MSAPAAIAPVLRQARGVADMDIARALMHEYAGALGVDLCFQGFEAELAGLPGDYAPPAGTLLLAFDGTHPLGCVAVRPLVDAACEMKRLYVRPEGRGLRLGRQLVEAAIGHARGAGHASMRLDTLPQMREAQALYASLGFRDIPAYCHNPLPGTRYMELALSPA
jgi:GNAT superfamily N-acetyltransferase